MTTHQAIAQRQSNANYKVQPTIVSNRKAIVVQLTWTDAPVVKTTIRKNFKLSVLAIDTKTWTPIQRSLMTLQAGQIVHFVQSDDHPGYYYITIIGKSCTCTSGLYKQHCHHQDDAVRFTLHMAERQSPEQEAEQWRTWAKGWNETYERLSAEHAEQFRQYQAKIKAVA